MCDRFFSKLFTYITSLNPQYKIGSIIIFILHGQKLSAYTEDKLISGGADFQNYYAWLQSQQWTMLIERLRYAESLNIGHYSDVHMEYGENYLKYAWDFVQVRQMEREKPIPPSSFSKKNASV